MTWDTASMAAPAASRAATRCPAATRYRGRASRRPGIEVHDLGEVFGRVDPPQLLDGRLAGRDARAGVVKPLALELAEDRLEPLGALRMMRGHAVLDHPPIREECDGHGSSRRCRTRWWTSGLGSAIRILPECRPHQGWHRPVPTPVRRFHVKPGARGRGDGRVRPDLPTAGRPVRIVGHELIPIANRIREPAARPRLWRR